jgi:hypothetical protein
VTRFDPVAAGPEYVVELRHTLAALEASSGC